MAFLTIKSMSICRCRKLCFTGILVSRACPLPRRMTYCCSAFWHTAKLEIFVNGSITRDLAGIIEVIQVKQFCDALSSRFCVKRQETLAYGPRYQAFHRLVGKCTSEQRLSYSERSNGTVSSFNN